MPGMVDWHRRELKAPFVVTVAVLAAACESGGDASGDCPATPPNLTPAEVCTPAVQQAGGCRYRVDCQSGPVDLTFTCKQDGSSVVMWSVVSDTCSSPFDSCPGANPRCYTGIWVSQAPSNPPQPCPETCPETKPAPGTAVCFACSQDCAICSASSCGYRCSSGGAWTVGSTYRAGAGCANGVWLFDGACPGDCSMEERALHELASANKSCTTAADCKVLRSECAFTKETCGGAFYVNASTDGAKWAELASALAACADIDGGEWSCDACNAIDPAPDCVSGRCVPKQ